MLVGGITVAGDVAGEELCVGPEILIETTERHVGLPGPRDERSVTCIGTVPRIGVVAISTCTRRAPEGLMRRVIRRRGVKVPPTDPPTATYEASGTVNSKEWRALSYI